MSHKSIATGTNEHRFSPPNDWNQHHCFLSSLCLLALLVSCTLRTRCELLLPSVASLRFSYLWFSVASRYFCHTLLPCLMVGLLLSRASSLINGSVTVSGYRRSSGPGGPAVWYWTFSWQHRSVRSASRKVVILLWSSLPHTCWVVYSRVPCLVPVARLELSTLSLEVSWCHPPHCPLPRGGASVGPVVVLVYLGDWSLALDSVKMTAFVGCFDVLASPLLCCFGLLLRVALLFFCSVGTRQGFSFHFLPALLVRISSSCFG